MNTADGHTRLSEGLDQAIGKPLRVAVLLDRYRQPAWVHAMLERIRSLHFVELCLTIELTAAARNDDGSVLWQFYRHADDRLFARSADALAEGDVSPLLHDMPRMAVDVSTISTVCFDGHLIDVALDLNTGIEPAAMAGRTRYGVWRHEFDDLPVRDPSAVGRREVFDQAPLTVSSLMGYRPDGERVVLFQSQSRTVPYSPRRNRDNAYWKAAAFASRALARLNQTHSLPPSQSHASPHTVRQSALNMPTSIMRAGRNLFRRGWQKLTTVDQWFIGFKFEAEPALPDALSGFQLLMPPKDRFWADPFPIEREGRHFIFIEELPFATNKGHISVMEVSPDGRWSEPRKVLERDYHLSYPFLFEWQGELFMLPETGQQRTVEVYRCHRFPDDWRLESVLLNGVCAADATISPIGERWWMFVNIGEEGTELYDELHLFHAEQPFGEWTPHHCNPVKSDALSARPAGKPFLADGVLYRPAQVCAPLYGSAIVINRIEQIDPEHFVEHEVARLTPDWLPGLSGCHTYNRAGGLTVIDGFKRTSRFPV